MAAWSCDACTFRNEDDARASCQVCNAVRVVTCPKCRKDIKCVAMRSLRTCYYLCMRCY